MTVRAQDLVFFAGGECLSRHGTLVQRTSPGEEVLETYTRTGTPRAPDPDGQLITYAANIPPIFWVDLDGDGTREPYLLLEEARTNLNDEDDLTAWSASGTPVVTGSQSGPAGGTGAFTVADDAGGAGEYIYNPAAFTGDAVKACVFLVKEKTMPAAGVQTVGLYDATAAAWRCRMDITSWSSGNPQITETTGTLLQKLQLTDGWWVLYCQTTSVTAANTNQLRILPADTAAQTGSIDVFRTGAFDALVPPTSILDASGAIGAASFTAPFPFGPQDLTLYLKASPRILAADSGASDNFLRLASSATALELDGGSGSDTLSAVLNDGSGNPDVDSGDLSEAFGDVLEAVLQYDHSTAMVKLITSLNGATATDHGWSSAGTAPSAWGSQTVVPGSWMLHAAAKVALGHYSLPEMRTA